MAPCHDRGTIPDSGVPVHPSTFCPFSACDAFSICLCVPVVLSSSIVLAPCRRSTFDLTMNVSPMMVPRILNTTCFLWSPISFVVKAFREPTTRTGGPDGDYLSALDGLIIRNMTVKNAGGECIRLRCESLTHEEAWGMA